MKDALPAGHPGTYTTGFRFRPGADTLQVFARAKLLDITLLSAAFGEHQALMAPTVWLYQESPRQARFLGVYESDPPPGRNLPDLCWRRSEWNLAGDAQQVARADPGAYLAGDSQITSEIVFTRRDREPDLAEMVDRSVLLFAQGLRVGAARRPTAEWTDVRAGVATDITAYQLGFSPLLATCPELEGWSLDWQRQLCRLDPARGIHPDSDIRMSYRRSWYDLLHSLGQPNG